MSNTTFAPTYYSNPFEAIDFSVPCKNCGRHAALHGDNPDPQSYDQTLRPCPVPTPPTARDDILVSKAALRTLFDCVVDDINDDEACARTREALNLVHDALTT